MALPESPLNAAHQHAANADEYMAQGLLIPASEEHHKAAESFQACVEASNDDNAKRTLRMLYSEHHKAGSELQRKIAKLREENKDPSLPQKVARTSAAAVPPTSPQPIASPPPQPRMSDSQQTVDESFMLLGQSDRADPFNIFWKITEGLLENLSQPVAFATAPLSPPEAVPAQNSIRRRDASSSSDTDIDDPISKRLSRGIGLVKAARSRMLTRHDVSNTSDSDLGQAGPSTFPPAPHPSTVYDMRDEWDDDVRAYDDDDMADSFCLIPSKVEQPSVLKKENVALKAELEAVNQQLVAAERMLKMRQEQDNHLRDSIMVARREAQRAMTASGIVPRPPPPPPSAQPLSDLSSLNINVPPVPAPIAPPNGGRDREAALLRRVRDLEEEVRVVRAENEKQKAMIVRFRERWEKLKESSKRKKEAKAAAEATNVIDDRIEEEPEAEAEAERNDQRAKREELAS